MTPRQIESMKKDSLYGIKQQAEEGKLALDIIPNKLMKEQPDRAALFLMIVMFPQMPSNRLLMLTWRSFDEINGLLKFSSGVTIMLPDLITDLLCESHQLRSDVNPSDKIFVTGNTEGRKKLLHSVDERRIVTDAMLAEFRETFEQYKASQSFRHLRIDPQYT